MTGWETGTRFSSSQEKSLAALHSLPEVFVMDNFSFWLPEIFVTDNHSFQLSPCSWFLRCPIAQPQGQARLIEVLIMTLHFPSVPSSPARALLLREVLFRVFQGFVSSSIVIPGRNGFAALQPHHHHPHPPRLKTAFGNTLG